MKVMEVVPDDYMILFFCIDYTVWPGLFGRKIHGGRIFFRLPDLRLLLRLEPPRSVRPLAEPNVEV